MLSFNLWKSKIVKISRFLLAPLEVRRHQRLPFRYLRKGLLMGLVFVLITAWIFSGWPQIYNFPPKIQEAQAAGSCGTTTITLAAGSYTGIQSTTITSGCAKICYTTDGATPAATTPGTCLTSDGHTLTYSTALSINQTETIKALGTQTAKTNSSVVTSAYTITVNTPTFGTNGGSSNNDMSSTILDVFTGATICYTTDGATPGASVAGTCNSDGHTQTYSTAVPVTATGTILKAIGTKASATNSALATSNAFTLTVANPSFGTDGGSFANDTSSTQTSTTTGAIFCQTVDGTTTPAASTPGTCSVGTTGATATVIATGKTIKVLGTKANYVNSAVQTSNAFTLTVGAITSSPGAGTYNSTKSVTLNIATTTSAVVHYTTDGSPVTCSSTTYTGAFNVSVTTTVKAIGCKTNYVSDTEISDLYTIGLSTTIAIRAQNYTTLVSSITFLEGASGATVSQPYNNIDGSGSPQTFGGAGSAKPVITLYNGSASTWKIWYNITTFTNSAVSNEYYLINTKGAACASADAITNAVIFDTDTVSAGATTIAVGAGNEKDLYLKVTLSASAGKSGTSTLTILGETP